MKFNSANFSSFSKPWITEDFGLAALQIFCTRYVVIYLCRDCSLVMPHFDTLTSIYFFLRFSGNFVVAFFCLQVLN